MSVSLQEVILHISDNLKHFNVSLFHPKTSDMERENFIFPFLCNIDVSEFEYVHIDLWTS